LVAPAGRVRLFGVLIFGTHASRITHQKEIAHMERWISLLSCPICGARLFKSGGVARCANRHTFDIAREGYINLYTSRQSGDTSEMLRARRSFLLGGHFARLSAAINTRVADYLAAGSGQGSDRGDAAVLDAGCGAGYYLRELKRHLDNQPSCRQPVYLGLDISKAAVRMAAAAMRARSEPDAGFVVADLKERIPCADRSIDVLLTIFAPRNPIEFARVLVRGGLLLAVIPTPRHLAEPCSALGLLKIGADKHERLVDQLAPWFTLAESHGLEYMIHLDRDDLIHLVLMTPNYWHQKQVRWSALPTVEGQATTIGVRILVFHRRDYVPWW
jgi:23S rRNA (guanine745-N1)-methyltransferase